MEYLTNTPIDQALSKYREKLLQAGISLPVETIDARAANGRSNTEAIYALRSVPHYLASAMDGIAVRAADTFGATETTPVTLASGNYTVVDTGDALPAGCDAVIMIEDVIWQSEDAVLIHAAVPWQHIRQIGEDFCAGDMLLPGASRITPAAVGILLAGGITRIKVLRRPVIHIIPTGDEIVPAADDLKPGDIPEFNSSVFASSLQQFGAIVEVQPIVPDEPSLLASALNRSLQESDWVLILAGSSAGRGDFTSATINTEGEVIVHGLAIRPGKPAVLGLCGSKPVIGIPGYPVSGLVVVEEILFPLLREFARLGIPRRIEVEATISRRVLSSLKYQEYIRVRLNQVNGRLTAIPMERGAGLLNSFARADGIVVIPQNSEGIETGQPVTVRLLRDIDDIRQTLCVIGSHDPLLDELSDLFHSEIGKSAQDTSRQSAMHLLSAHAGSMGGLMAIMRGEAQLAGIHLMDAGSGVYNLPLLTRYFPDNSVVLVEGVRRMQGLLTSAGNPKKITGLSCLDRPGIRYVNRQSGSGTRILLDFQLDQLHIAPDRISGYTREEITHSGVAAQIAAGSADTGLAIMAAARLFGLEFIPVAEECYDFAVRKDILETPLVRRFLALLKSAEFRRRLEIMGGYRLITPGEIITGHDSENINRDVPL